MHSKKLTEKSDILEIRGGNLARKVEDTPNIDSNDAIMVKLCVCGVRLLTKQETLL